MKVNRIIEDNAGEAYEKAAVDYLNNKYGKELKGIEFKHMGGNDNSKPDIAVMKNGNLLFYIECKDLPAQAGEFALRLDGDKLTFIPNQNTSEEEGGKDTPKDIKCKQDLVDWLNASKYKDQIINDYSTKGEVNIRLKDPELIDLMKQRIKTHYGNMNASWFCAPSKNDPYSFVLVNELDQLMNVDAVTVRNKSNNSKNISVASYDSFIDFAKKNGFTNLQRNKRGNENVVTFDSKKDLGLKNAKQNIHIMIGDKEYVITINTHPDVLPGSYMLRNSSRGNIKVLASLGKAKSGVDNEEGLINYIKKQIHEDLDMRKNLSEELEINDDIKLNNGEEEKPEEEKEGKKVDKEIQKELDAKNKIADEIRNAEAPKAELNDGMGKSLKVKQFVEKLTLEEPTHQLNEAFDEIEDIVSEYYFDLVHNIFDQLIDYCWKVKDLGTDPMEACQAACDEALMRIEDDDELDG